jgi:hypothetical protein
VFVETTVCSWARKLKVAVALDTDNPLQRLEMDWIY